MHFFINVFDENTSNENNKNTRTGSKRRVLERFSFILSLSLSFSRGEIESEVISLELYKTMYRYMCKYIISVL